MRPFLQRSLLLVLLLMGLRAMPAAASHLLGGEITYSYLNANGPAATPYRYRVTVLVYVNAGSTSSVPDGRPSVDVAFYNKTTGNRLQTVTIQRTSNPIITPPQPGGCSTPGGAPITVRLVRYETIVNLPLAFEGYYAVYTDGTRNAGILNLAQSDSWGQLIYVEMAPPLIPNSSPTFSDTAVVVVCQGDTSIIVNNAVDADGDRLIYSFSRPYGSQGGGPLPTVFTPPPPAVTYANGYSQTAPFGTGPGRYAFLNASNGISSYATALLGAYVVAVEVKEYRTINGAEVLIGSTRREIQLVSRTCQPNRAPQFTPSTLATRLYTVEEGQTVSFNLAATDADGNPINMKVNSVLLDGSGPFNATFAGSQGVVQPGNPTGTVTVNGTSGSVNGQFVFNSSCGTARNTPYDIVVTATDVTCGAKSIADVFQIQVTKAAGPTSVTGEAVICDRAQVATYTAVGPVASSYLWSAQGGTIQGSNTNNTVQVRWNTVGAGRVTVKGISALGCPSDSVSRAVDVRPASGLAVTANPTICEGTSTTLTASGAQNYAWTGGGQNSTSATITVAPTQTTTYTVTTTDGVCTTARQVTVTVNPRAIANAGADASVCSGSPTQLGAASLAGYTYQWSPATGLSSATVANPTFLQTNTTSAPQQITYTLTATTAQGCVATDQVTVTLNQAAVAQAGPNPQAFCSGGSAAIGVLNSGVAGVTYLWTPATGLANPAAPATTVTLTNTGTAPISTDYILRATTAQGCTAVDTVRVTVNPAAIANAGTSRAVCSGETVTLGAASLAGYTYLWSPATGLSSTSAAQPTFSQVNNGTAPQTYTFNLLATTAQGCTATASVTITVNPAAVAVAGADRVFCSGGSAALGDAASAVAGSTYLWSPATGLSAANTPNPIVTLTNTGTTPIVTDYVLLVTTNLGCLKRDTVRVTVNPAAVAIAGTDRAICSGETTQLGSAALAGYSYSWSPATGLSSATSANPTFSLANTGTTPQLYTFTVTATTAQGCTATSTVRVTVNPASVANAGADRAVCSNTATQLGSAALAGYSYSWSPATGLSSATSANPTFSLANTGTTPQLYTFTVTATTAQGCTATSTVRVTVNPAAVANAGTSKAFCSGESATLGNAGSVVAGSIYQWSPATGLSSATSATPTVTLTNTGTTPITTTYTLTVNTAFTPSCPATSTVTVTVNPAAVANAGADVALCAGATTTLGTTALAGYSYSWSPAANLSSAATARPVFTAVNNTLAPITTTYTVTARTAEGCENTDAVVVTVNPTPLTDSIQGSQSVCPTVQGVVYSIRNPRSATYQWTVVGGTIASGQGTPSITVNWGGPNAAASVRAFAINTTLCQSAAVVLPVRINQLLQTARPTGPNNVCQANGPYTYQTVLTTGSSYAWSIIGGTQVATSANTVTVNWTRPGIGKIAVFETTNPTGGRCISQTPLDTLYVNVLPSPLATLAISGPSRACVNGGTISFTLPGAANSTYAYTLNGAAISGTTGTVTLPIPAAPGTYTLTAQEKNASLCSGPTYSRQFTVVPALAISGPANYCPETRTGLTYTVGTTASALPNANYQWSVTGGGTIASGQGTGTVTVNFPAGTTAATVQVSDVNSAGCASIITVRPDNASVALQAASVASGDRSITLRLSVPNNAGNGGQVKIMRRDAGATGAFITVGTVANTATTFTDTNVDADAKAYEYRLELLNSCGTALQSQDHTTIRTVATATEGQSGRDEGKVSMNWNAYRGFEVKEYQIFRSADNGAAQLVATVPAATLRTELASSTAGFDQCLRVVAVSTSGNLTAASNDACVTFTNELVFYNVVTPNSDGLNDKFEIKNVELYPGSSMTILNRWGKEVYSKASYDNSWSGAEQPAGVYYYLLKLSTGKTYKGWFELVK
ncbi:gliding motility-associated C-terminal domain-containing protein [Hymenobacter daecheongensis DSM 21074]|uniref:Gliding motility-associated C-terminal domain-containing protein n=1 Tax=Hymenobacter daecheongensis DSM 21074 TaxID=1121955 RepID=A0A1M6EZ29_9BACT|nr:gliding motility-associated C-terminal domain-containing protein [Hymenobacter daecheongensis]SHI90692.1 gliding motility-associated C-terminal domain-containing protein [Hymenobacter daecheongensis DSM 21074]